MASASRCTSEGDISHAARFGGIGAGTAYKLIINMIGAVQIASVAEGIAIAERVGLDLKVVAEAITTGQAATLRSCETAAA